MGAAEPEPAPPLTGPSLLAPLTPRAVRDLSLRARLAGSPRALQVNPRPARTSAIRTSRNSLEEEEEQVEEEGEVIQTIP